jgi:acyl-CoA synthetase (AMP-forming)/AMP-acid ligase II
LIHLDEREITARAGRVAAGWARLGLAPGDSVAALAGNSAEFVIAREAATALELWFVPVNPRLAPPEMEHIVSVARPRALVVEPAVSGWHPAAVPTHTFAELEAMAGAAPPLRTAAGATILFTSGTTGRPKGCLRPEAAEAARVAELTASHGLGPTDIHLVACPLAHSAPGIFLRACRLAGARTVILPRFDARTFPEQVRDSGATVCFLVPTQVERLLAGPRTDLRPLRALIVAGAPFAPASRARLVDWLGPGRLHEFYGSSETGTITVHLNEQSGPPGFVGHPPPGVTVEIAAAPGEVGEIRVRSAACMAGYIGEPPVPQGGFVAPGDLGRMTPDGGIVLVDRKGDLIITGGVNVYPAEVERALLEHPAVRGAVVFGLPNSEWGEQVCALVAGDAAEADLRAFLRDRIAAYKIPKRFTFIGLDELPIGATGKPLRRLARERWG